jgi:hypothetical protein
MFVKIILDTYTDCSDTKLAEWYLQSKHPKHKPKIIIAAPRMIRIRHPYFESLKTLNALNRMPTVIGIII